jgi:hypothetical protein
MFASSPCIQPIDVPSRVPRALVRRVGNVPWFGPGVLLSVVAAALLAVPLGRALSIRPLMAGMLVLCFGVILSATLTPLRGALETGAFGTGICDFSGLDSTPLDEPRLRNDRTLNVALFAPLGLVIGLLPFSWRTGFVLVLAIALPFAVETVQLMALPLARGCQLVDVVDNLTGLSIGLVLGVALKQTRRIPNRWGDRV